MDINNRFCEPKSLAQYILRVTFRSVIQSVKTNNIAVLFD